MKFRSMQKLYLLLGLFFVSFGLSSAATFPTVAPVDNYASLSGSPARIAIGGDGTLYVTDPTRGVVEILSNNGILMYSLTPTEAPLGIAIDQAGRMVISDIKMKNVGVYRGIQDADRGSLLFKVGVGDGEFGLPNGIAVGPSGNIYVTDSKNNVVKMYSSDGSPSGSFGAGVLNFPTGISLDSNNQIYVIDHNNLLIRYYDLNGTPLGVIDEACRGGMLGVVCKNLLRPLGITSDSSRLYVTDAFHSAIAVYDKDAKAFLGYIGQYGDAANEYKTPVDVAFDYDSKMFVTNGNNQRIEVLGVDTFSGIGLAPEALSATLYRGGSPVVRSLQVSAVGTASSWTASAASPWMSLSQSSGSVPSSVDVAFDPAGLSVGRYSSNILFQTPAGVASYIPASLEVKRPALVASQSDYYLVYQKGAAALPFVTIGLDSVGAVLNWTASSDSAWLKLDRIAGTTPQSLQAAITKAAIKFKPGSYDAIVTVSGGDADGSPVKIRVHLDVIMAGTLMVTTNREDASFALSGPESFAGSGLSWTRANVTPGTYTVSFGHVSGYVRPAPKTVTISSGATQTVSVIYREKAARTHILAGSGSVDGNMVRLIPLAGGPSATISPFALSQGIRVAAGDLNGDGIDELIVANSINAFRVYDRNGDLIMSKVLGSSVSDLEIAIGDVEGDGLADIVVAYVKSNVSRVEAYGLKGTKAKKKKGLALKQPGRVIQTLALGDVNGDGRKDLVVASASFVRAYSLNPLTLLWSSVLNETACPNISSGDLDDDGIDEIAIAPGPASVNGTVVRFLKGNGSVYEMEIRAFDDYTYGATVALGDTDGDGADDIVVGAGPAATNEALIKLFDSDGSFSGTMINALSTFYGVSVGTANFGGN